MNKVNNYLIGSDPEAFIVNGEGTIVSSIPLIPGTKADPYPIGKGCSIQHDNILAEWCIPPTRNPEDFHQSILHCVEWTESVLPENHKVVFITSFHVEQDQLEDVQAKEFGCEPDHNAWAMGEPNTKPNTNTNLRTAGGHIHIGYDNSTEEMNMEIIRTLDLFLAVPALYLDEDTHRRSLYGKAGSFRHKPYGVEYRSLSNFWVKDQSLINWVFEQIDVAIDFINCGGIIADTDKISIQLAVDNNDQLEAATLIREYSMSIPEYVN